MPTPTDNRSSHRAGLKQIADELGISMMTVSRALNGRGDVAESTRLRVLKAAKRFKYRPNRLVAEHLLALGHRRLGHITGEPWVSTYAERRRGFEEVVARPKGVDLSVAECADVDSEAAARAMLSRPDRPTAIFVPNDRMAPPIYEVAESLGLVIGRDLSVIGFGSLEEAKCRLSRCMRRNTTWPQMAMTPTPAHRPAPSPRFSEGTMPPRRATRSSCTAAPVSSRGNGRRALCSARAANRASTSGFSPSRTNGRPSTAEGSRARSDPSA